VNQGDKENRNINPGKLIEAPQQAGVCDYYRGLKEFKG
jgi:hypothetical protein